MFRDVGDAWAKVDAVIPEDPIVIVINPQGRVYSEGQPVDWKIDLSGDVALANGSPCVVKVLNGYGNYDWHEDFGPEQYEESRDELFEAAMADIKKHRFDNTQWDQRTLEEKIAAGDAGPEPTPRELCEIQYGWDFQFLTTGVGEYRKDMLRCICNESDCPRRSPRTSKEWELLNAANYTHDLGTVELMQNLVDQAAKTGK
jgi:hypothetical protein